MNNQTKKIGFLLNSLLVGFCASISYSWHFFLNIYTELSHIVGINFYLVCIFSSVAFFYFRWIKKKQIVPISNKWKLVFILTSVVAAGLLVWFVEPATLSKVHRVEITATKENDKKALSDEVWISNINIDDISIPLDSFVKDSNWEIENNSLVYSGKTVSTITWQGRGNDTLQISFLLSKWSGYVKVKIDDSVVDTLNLYNSNTETKVANYRLDSSNDKGLNFNKRDFIYLLDFLLLTEMFFSFLMISWIKIFINIDKLFFSFTLKLNDKINTLSINIFIILLSFFYSYLLDIRGFILFLSSLLIYSFIRFSLKRVIGFNFYNKTKEILSFLILALLFCLMIPLSSLIYQGTFFQLSIVNKISIPLLNFLKLLEVLLRISFTYCLAFLATVDLWMFLLEIPITEVKEKQTFPGYYKTMICYMIPFFVIGLLFFYAYYPGVLSADSFYQWNMIDNLSTLDDWHPVAHTLLEYFLTRVWYSPASISIFQLLVQAIIWGVIMSYFEFRGFSRKHLFLFSFLYSILPYNCIYPMILWKDVLYAYSNILLIFLLGLVWVSHGNWLYKVKSPIILGCATALPFLFRHNGIVVVCMVFLGELLLFKSKWKPVLVTLSISCLLLLGIRNGLAFGLLKAEPNPEGTMYVIPIQHINAVIANGGKVSEEQEEVLKNFAPIKIWKSSYNPYWADTMTKPWGVMHDESVESKIDHYKVELIKVFLDYLKRYPLVIAKSELDLMSLQWKLSTTIQYKNTVYDYATVSGGSSKGEEFKYPFIQVNAASFVRKMLDNYLNYTHTEMLLYTIFWKGGIYLFITIFLLFFSFVQHGKNSLLLFIPSIANIISLFLAMPVQNFRYIYPWVISVFVLFWFSVCNDTSCDQYVGTRSNP